ncbi:GT4 family glycosyltransferase PelF [Mycoplasmatota bacterium WC44]
MIVCLLIEGSYPYVVGGVSGWVNSIIKAMPNVEFKILSIMPSETGKLEIKYKLPDNVIELKTIYLDGYIDNQNGDYVNQVRLSKKEEKELSKLLHFDLDIDLSKVLEIMDNKKSVRKVENFTRTKFFYNILKEKYFKNYSDLNFNKYVWTSKGMYNPFLFVLDSDIPKADIYHSVSAGYAGLIGAVAKVRFDKPFILSEHGIYTRERQEEIVKANWIKKVFKMIWIDFFFYVSNIGYKYADKITSLFHDARKFQIVYGAEEEKCIVISNGVNVESFDIQKKDHKSFNIGFITRVVPIKDVLTAIRAFYLVNKKMDNVNFYIIGPTDEDEKYYEQCLKLTETLGLNNVVHFTGTVNIKDYLPETDVVILSSLSEGQPLVLLEAMSAGIPCVTTDVGSCKEVLNADASDLDKCGIIYEPTNYEQLASKLIYLYENIDLREKMGANGKERANSLYNYKDMVNKYFKLYEDVIKKY